MERYFAGKQDLKDKNILITAGPTYEKIDPVRFIGNYSSGKMGFSLAEECAERGATVTLVCGPTSLSAHHPNIKRINIESAAQMYEQAVANFTHADAAILCAAVADFTPDVQAENKIKREGNELTLHLKPTKDIAKELGKLKSANQVLVGFALETCNEVQNAQGKLKRKNLDFIVLNSLNDAGAGFRHDTNKISIITSSEQKNFPLKSKTEVAKDIIDQLSSLL